MTYKDAVDYIYNIPKFTKKNSLDHTRRLLGMLVHPEKSFRILHVAGTNGKGSVCNYANEILMEAGYKTGMFTSPHLSKMEERFLINGKMISEEEFLEDFKEVLKVVKQEEIHGEAHPTFFEFLFLMSYVRFNKAGIDIAIYEAGMGGRLDATNAFEKKDVTVITSIGLDHTEYLGTTISEIAMEKAGIMRPGVPCVFDADNLEANTTILGQAESIGAVLYPVERRDTEPFFVRDGGIDFSYTFDYDKDDYELRIPTVAFYQLKNVALAIKAASFFLPDKDKFETIRAGILKAKWPGRMDEVLPHIYVDGAHNPPGIKEVLITIDDLMRNESGSKPILVFSMVGDKDYKEVIRLILEKDRFSQVILTDINDIRGLSKSSIKEEIEKYSEVNIKLANSAEEALKTAKDLKEENQTVFCLGSLYLAGELISAAEKIGRKEK